MDTDRIHLLKKIQFHVNGFDFDLDIVSGFVCIFGTDEASYKTFTWNYLKSLPTLNSGTREIDIYRKDMAFLNAKSTPEAIWYVMKKSSAKIVIIDDLPLMWEKFEVSPLAGEFGEDNWYQYYNFFYGHNKQIIAFYDGSGYGRGKSEVFEREGNRIYLKTLNY